MTQAKISEIFLSYQGEGPFIGSRQLFLRFYGCNLKCTYCDTPQESYKQFSKEELLTKILDFEEDYNELAVTGGEPLLCSEFLEVFIPSYKQYKEKKVYLETNGTLPEKLGKVIDFVDIISMDIKLPSSSGNDDRVWGVHKEFIDISLSKELIVKTVITENTIFSDIKKMAEIISAFKIKFPVVLQPVTPVDKTIKPADDEMISYFKGYLEKETGKEVYVLGQAHKCMGIR